MLPGLLVFMACGSASSRGPTPLPAGPAAGSAAAGEMPFLEERALLLLQADRRLFEPLSIAASLDGDADLRRFLALTLGRMGEPRGVGTLEALTADGDPGVRRAAAFALGEVAQGGVRIGHQALLGTVLDADRDVGRLSVEALAKAGADLEDVVARLIEGPSSEFFPRLLPSLFLFEGPGVLRWAEQGLEEGDVGPGGGKPGPRAMAAYALARNPKPEGAPLLRPLLEDPDPWVRGWAARALGRVGDRSDLERIRPLLEDAERGPLVQALRAGRALVNRGVAAPPDDWRPRLLELLADPRVDVRLTAVEASAAWLLDDTLGERLAKLGASEIPRERQLALLALAEGEDPRAIPLLTRAASAVSARERTAAVRAAGFAAQVDLLTELLGDLDPGVRRTALETLLDAVDPDLGVDLVRRALQDRDPAVRASALAWTQENPMLDVAELDAAMTTAMGDRSVDARIAAVRALAALTESVPSARDAATLRLAHWAEKADYLARREAALALVSLGQAPPALGTVDTGRSIDIYREIALRTATPKRVTFRTDKGDVELELPCSDTPFTCLSFLQLANQGFFEGLTFHRVIPDFVVQGGDPRGDGAGGPGYTLRDEVGLLRFDRGILGMAHSGPDTAGSQFFVTLSPQPHLDGGYTAFGRVVEGQGVLESLVQGDRIQAVTQRSPDIR